jgi:hypothetical protein
MYKFTAGMLSVAAFAITTAAPAQADEPDFNRFIADLQRAGVTYGKPSDAIDFGMHICNAMQSGDTLSQVFARVAAFGIGPQMGGPIVAISVDDLCPDQRANMDNQARSPQSG